MSSCWLVGRLSCHNYLNGQESYNSKVIFKPFSLQILCSFCDNEFSGGLRSLHGHLFSKHNVRLEVSYKDFEILALLLLCNPQGFPKKKIRPVLLN